MALHARPRLKIIRRLGVPLPGLTAKVSKREKPVVRGRPRKLSDYALQLIEKQKVRFNYGITESQLRSYFRYASAQKGVTGELLLSVLESRLDNVVFRLGFARTIPAARQLVGHRHVLVDGRRVNVPAYRVRPGQVIAVLPESRSVPMVQENVAHRDPRRLPGFLEIDPGDPFVGRVIGTPRRDDVPFAADEAAVVAYYSRRG